jgi:gluconate 2-dehydrogenase gamma chain
MNVDRRQFCQHVVYVGLGSYLAFAVGACRRKDPGNTAPAPTQAAGFCTPMEFETLAAACERLFPADDDPGAIALDAPQFVDRELMSEAFSGWQDFFRHSLADLDADALARYQRFFVKLNASEQDALLDTWAQGSKSQQLFMHRLMHLTLEGCFCDPSHGGNRGGRAWALVGFQPSSPRPGEHDHHHMHMARSTP